MKQRNTWIYKSPEQNTQLKADFAKYTAPIRVKPRDMPIEWQDKIDAHTVYYEKLRHNPDQFMEEAWYEGRINPYQASKYLYLFEELSRNEPWFPSQAFYHLDNPRNITCHPGIVKSRVQYVLNKGVIDLWNTQEKDFLNHQPLNFDTWLQGYRYNEDTDITGYEVRLDMYEDEYFVEMFPEWDNSTALKPYDEFRRKWENTLTKHKYGKERTLYEINQMNYRIVSLGEDEDTVKEDFI